MMRKTKIVCTLGPSTEEVGVLASLLEAGMNVARFNMAHGTHEYHADDDAAGVREASRVDRDPRGAPHRHQGTRGPHRAWSRETGGWSLPRGAR